jgi:RimJ/RimL family protein N-acetyltransferase
LLKWDLGHVKALLHDKNDLEALLQVSVPVGWPQFPEAFTLPTDETEASTALATKWGGYFFIHTQNRALVGSGGFHFQSDNIGTVEIGYEIASEYWNRGFATEAVHKMVDFAFADEQVTKVIAHTLADVNASNSVLQKVGMKYITEEDDPEQGKVWLWQISRDQYHAT